MAKNKKNAAAQAAKAAKVEATEPKAKRKPAAPEFRAPEPVAAATPPTAPMASVRPVFSREDLARLELGQLRVENADQAAKLQRHMLDAFVRDVQERVKGERAKVDAKIQEVELQKAALASVYRDLEAKYEISMAEIAYDPKSGVINRLPAGFDAAVAKSNANGGAIVPTV